MRSEREPVWDISDRNHPRQEVVINKAGARIEPEKPADGHPQKPLGALHPWACGWTELRSVGWGIPTVVLLPPPGSYRFPWITQLSGYVILDCKGAWSFEVLW